MSSNLVEAPDESADSLKIAKLNSVMIESNLKTEFVSSSNKSQPPIFLPTSLFPMDSATFSGSNNREYDSGYELASLSSALSPADPLAEVKLEMRPCTHPHTSKESLETVMTLRKNKPSTIKPINESEEKGKLLKKFDCSRGSVDSFLSVETGTDLISDDTASISSKFSWAIYPYGI